MAWSTNPEILTLTASLLDLSLKAERLRIAHHAASVVAQARAMGVPEAAMKRALPGNVTYTIPPLQYLTVDTKGEF